MSTTTPHAEHQLRYPGAVDADGHILEPVDLWERYLEPQYRDRVHSESDFDPIRRHPHFQALTEVIV